MAAIPFMRASVSIDEVWHMKQLLLKASVAVAFLALLAWLAVPNVLEARNRGRQKRTMADIRSIATAWEARATDTNSYYVAGSPSVERRVSPAELARALEPQYSRRLPPKDGWGTEFQFTTSGSAKASEVQSYAIRSLGSDGRADRIATLTGTTTNFTDDIVYSNGSFIRYPESAG
jgi:general secretion pathway protein G